MSTLRISHRAIDRQRALDALRAAIVDGATYDYERLVNSAVSVGVTDAQLDRLLQSAVEILFYSDEHPVTSRELANCWPVDPMRAYA